MSGSGLVQRVDGSDEGGEGGYLVHSGSRGVVALTGGWPRIARGGKVLCRVTAVGATRSGGLEAG